MRPDFWKTECFMHSFVYLASFVGWPAIPDSLELRFPRCGIFSTTTWKILGKPRQLISQPNRYQAMKVPKWRKQSLCFYEAGMLFRKMGAFTHNSCSWLRVHTITNPPLTPPLGRWYKKAFQRATRENAWGKKPQTSNSTDLPKNSEVDSV